MRRDPKPFQKCQKCFKRAEGRRCIHCGSDRVVWSFIVDTNEPGGRRRQVQRSGFKTKEAALVALREVQATVESGRPEPTKLTTGEFLDRWLASVEGQVRGGTWQNLESAVRLHLQPALGGVPLRRLTRTDVKAFVSDLVKRRSAKTTRNLHGILRWALNAAVEDGLIASNPAARIRELPSGKGPEMKVWTAEQAKAFLEATKDDPLYPMWRLALVTGMRRGELLGLRWTDLDTSGTPPSVSIGRQYSRQGKAGVSFGETKSGRGRRVDLDAATVAILREHRGKQEIVGIEGLVFSRADGTPMDPDSVTGWFQAAVRRTNLPRIRLHDLRHTAITMMLRARVHPKVVAERVGHANVGITLDRYSHWVPALGEDAADRLAALVDA